MSITLTTTNPAAQIARAAILAAVDLVDLAHVREVVLTVPAAFYFADCYCEEGTCPNRAVASAIYIDAEDGQTEQALCVDCVRPAIEWLRMSDQVDQNEDIEIYVSRTWLSDTHKLVL